MANPTQIPGDLLVPGQLRHAQNFAPLIARSQLLQDDLAKFVIPHTDWRVWDALTTLLPSAGASDDLGLIQGTFGSASPSIQTGDVKALGTTTRRARALIRIPAEYVAGQTLKLRFHAGLLTTLSDGAATLDAEAFKSNGEAGIGSDLVTPAAQSIKSLSLADIDFTIDGTALSPGDWLDVRISIAITDAATVTAVIGIIGESSLLADIKG